MIGDFGSTLARHAPLFFREMARFESLRERTPRATTAHGAPDEHRTRNVRDRLRRCRTERRRLSRLGGKRRGALQDRALTRPRRLARREFRECPRKRLLLGLNLRLHPLLLPLTAREPLLARTGRKSRGLLDRERRPSS